MTATIEVPKGLKGLAVADTQISDVKGREGFYHYRQYSAVELAEKRSFEDVCHLLFEGHLPDKDESRRYRDVLSALRAIPEGLTPLIEVVASSGVEALTGLRTVISHLAGYEAMPPSHDVDHDRLLANARRLVAVTPTVVAALYRRSRELTLVPPDPTLPYASNYLAMITGTPPTAERAAALERYLILAMDHGFNASTFTARVVTSTGADLGAAIVGGIAALSGPLHGGAPRRALEMLEQIGTPANARQWVRDAIARGDRIMGFGHAVYRTKDPRSESQKAVVSQLGGERAELAVEVESLVEQSLAELKPERPLQANIEFYAGVLMEQCGLPPDLFTPTFAVARTAGWCAQALEQAEDRGAIIRPSARYVGPPAPQPVPS